MKTNVYDTASAILRIVHRDGGDVVASAVQQHLSSGQKQNFEPALNLLSRQGEVEVYTARAKSGPGRKGRHIRALHPTPAPDPHCSTCTCHDVL